MREMAPIGEMAPGCAKKYKKEIFKTPFAPGAISRMITVCLTSDSLTGIALLYTYVPGAALAGNIITISGLVWK